MNQQQERNPKSPNFMGMRGRMLTSDSQQEPADHNKMSWGKTAVWMHARVQLFFFIFSSDGTLINKLLLRPCDFDTKWRCHCSLSKHRVGGGSFILFVFMSHASTDLNRQVWSYWQWVRTLPIWCTTVKEDFIEIPSFIVGEQLLCWWSGLGVMWSRSVWMHVCLVWAGLASCCTDMCLWGGELSLIWWHLHCECNTPPTQPPPIHKHWQGFCSWERNMNMPSVSPSSWE